MPIQCGHFSFSFALFIRWPLAVFCAPSIHLDSRSLSGCFGGGSLIPSLFHHTHLSDLTRSTHSLSSFYLFLYSGAPTARLFSTRTALFLVRPAGRPCNFLAAMSPSAFSLFPSFSFAFVARFSLLLSVPSLRGSELAALRFPGTFSWFFFFIYFLFLLCGLIVARACTSFFSFVFIY